MDDSKSQNVDANSAIYWKSVGVAGLAVGIVSFLIKTGLTYVRLQLNTENPLSIVYFILGIIAFVWLIRACSGAFASWYYNRNSINSVSTGRAAMIGFLTGVAITIVSIILSQIWHWVDPGMIQQRMQNDIAVLKSIHLPADTKKQLIKSVSKNFTRPVNPGKDLFQGIFVYGIPNLITAMIGAKIFRRKPENKQSNKQARHEN